MRKTIIFGALAALFGFAALAQASERRDDAQVTRSVGGEHERDARSDGLRERRDTTSDQQHEAREGRHEDEDAEHRDRR
jgi:hypothetical protein